jgi:hypothetical protein
MEQDYVRLSGDKAVDYKEISGYIYELFKKFNVKKIIFDR